MHHVLEQGDRVVLRFPVESDRAEFVALLRASRDHLRPWFPNRPPAWDVWGNGGFDRELRHRQTNVGERWLICRKTDETIVGRLALTSVERNAFQNGRFGYWLGTDHTGQGYMTEALRLGLKRCFGPLGLHRIEANLMPKNESSRRVVAAAGFQYVGRSPRYLQIAGIWEDHEHWAITREMIDDTDHSQA